MKETLDYLEEIISDDENSTHIYIEPPKDLGNLSGEDDAPEDGSGLPDDICRSQLRAPCEVLLSSGKRLETEDDFFGFENFPDETCVPEFDTPPSSPSTFENVNNNLSKVIPTVLKQNLPKSNKESTHKTNKMEMEL